MSHITNMNCYLCSESIKSFAPLVAHSLYGKYSSSHNMYYNRQIDEILEETLTPMFINYQDYKFYDQDQQFLKREYTEEEFGNKIQILSEYYKFHRNIPTWNDKGVDQIMDRFYCKVKDVDYKKIKSFLKKEQGISLTTHQSFSSFSHSDCTQKSEYSMMLNNLNKSNESLQFLEICDKIEKAFKKVKVEQNFKGSYYSGQRRFEEYLDKHKQRKQQKDKENNKNEMSKKTKLSHKVSATKYQICLKQIAFSSNHTIKDRKYCTEKNTIAIEKTKINESNTQHSHNEKIRRQKSKTSFQPIYKNSLSTKNLENKNNFVCELVKSKIKSIKKNTISMINNENHKNINHIYKPTEIYAKSDKIVNEINRNSSVKTLSKLKFRSNSQSNLPTNQVLTKTTSKNQLLQRNKTYGPPRNIPLQTIKPPNTQFGQQKILTSRQSSHKILRTNSFGKFSSNCKQYETSSIPQQNCLKKGPTVLQTMLQKKLRVVKKKQLML